MDKERMWDILLNDCGISEETIHCVTSINGYTKETMKNILYWRAGTYEFSDLFFANEQTGGYYDNCGNFIVCEEYM